MAFRLQEDANILIWLLLEFLLYVQLQMATGKMLEQGPVLIITFQVYMINVVRNMEGKVVEGDPVGFFISTIFSNLYT